MSGFPRVIVAACRLTPEGTDIVLDVRNRAVLRFVRRAHLSPIQFNLARLLLAARGSAVLLTELCRDVWWGHADGGPLAQAGTLAIHRGRTRDKLRRLDLDITTTFGECPGPVRWRICDLAGQAVAA